MNWATTLAWNTTPVDATAREETVSWGHPLHLLVPSTGHRVQSSKFRRLSSTESITACLISHRFYSNQVAAMGLWMKGKSVIAVSREPVKMLAATPKLANSPKMQNVPMAIVATSEHARLGRAILDMSADQPSPRATCQKSAMAFRNIVLKI